MRPGCYGTPGFGLLGTIFIDPTTLRRSAAPAGKQLGPSVPKQWSFFEWQRGDDVTANLALQRGREAELFQHVRAGPC